MRSVDLTFFNKVNVEGVLIEDRNRDTLLYAGRAKANLTDWFFMKEKAVLHYIALENAYINAYRNDSTWNYQFLVDYFSSPKKGSGKKGIEFSLEELHLLNVRVKQVDNWIGKSMESSIGAMSLFINKIDYTNKILDIRSLDLDSPVFTQSDYEGKRPPKAKPAVVLDNIPVVNAFKWNNSGWKVTLADLDIKNGLFQNEKPTLRAPFPHMFDGQHLLFTNINGSFRNFSAWNDTIRANVNLSAAERSGFNLKQLKADIRFTPELMEFSNLDLVTGKTHLRDYFSMSYNSFNSDMSDFIHKVVMEGHFEDSEIHSDDIAYFAPAVYTWNRRFFLDGKAKGTVDDFTATGMNIRTGSTFLDGSFSIAGLPDINNSYISLSANRFTSTYKEIELIAPALRSVSNPRLDKLGNLSYKGTFKGFTDDFEATGVLNTDLGTVEADINMKIEQGSIPEYDGSLSTGGFKLGTFLQSDQLGLISFNGKVKGKGFKLEDLNSDFDGKVMRIDYAGYPYRDILISGNFKKQVFTGHLESDDPNVQVNSIDGTVSLSGKEISVNAGADIKHINFQNLGLVNNKVSLSGLFSLNFTGSNIDNFLGTAKVYDATLRHDTSLLSFDYLNLSSEMIDGSKFLRLESNEIEGTIMGKFSIIDLPQSFKYFLNRYYPNYIKKPAYAVKDQDFVFDIKTRQVEDYLSLFDRRIKGLNDSHFSGRLDMNSYVMSLNGVSPYFEYGGKKFLNISIQGKGNSDSLTTDVLVDNIEFTDSLHFPKTELRLTAKNDVSDISLKTSAGEFVNDAELNASIQTLADGVRIRFFPSTFVLNEKKWTLEKDGQLTIRKNFVDADDIRFIQGEQQIIISTELSDLTDETNVVAKLTKVDLKDFLPFVITRPSVSGILTGTAVLRDPFGKMIVDFRGKSDSTSLDGNYVGNLQIDASANTRSGNIDFKTVANDSAYAFNISGFYNYKDSSASKLKVNLLASRMNLRILQPYMNTIFSDMEGPAETNLELSGDPDRLFLTGQARILEGSVTIAYTRCRYTMKDETILFRKDEIDLDRIQVRDTLNNDGVITGRMYHQFFKKFRFDDIRFETAKMVLLNTTKKDNQQFYGNVIGNASMRVYGPVTNLQMDITGAPSELDSSHIYLPTGSEKESNAIDYIEFIQFGSLQDDTTGSEATNIFVTLNINANPTCRVDVILDETTGDIIRGQGTGNIQIKVGNREPLSIRGRYDITRGTYDFNFQTFLRKPFTLSNGYILWTGDPYAATIDIEAEYLAKNVDVNVLAPTGGFNKKEDINIISHLTGLLQKPEIQFEFALQENSDLKNDYIAVRKLKDFQNDQAEMNKQVASLLLFNQFLSTEGSFLSYENTLAIATNTIGGIVSSWLTNVLNRELERATNGVVSTYIDINPTFNIQSAANQLQANIRAGLKVLFSNRLVFLVGGNIEYNNATALQLARRGLITPDITIEWLLNKEGSLRVIGFNRTSFIDLTLGQRNSSGTQLTYRKEFDRLGDIFKSRKKIDELTMIRHTKVRMETN